MTIEARSYKATNVKGMNVVWRVSCFARCNYVEDLPVAEEKPKPDSKCPKCGGTLNVHLHHVKQLG
ncbi:hypothetical protein [Bacillus thuringiensis]|uniref:hypothetical protein n=1 Tax=Bacillus thuringiensis TaxID=1428 RepID=UPI000BFD4089|nr:hypothetical protein [Bacillus thuringiensis]PGT89927.1 hypothetical protein COD17_09255 [Bacillus thuringiensis]